MAIIYWSVRPGEPEYSSITQKVRYYSPVTNIAEPEYSIIIQKVQHYSPVTNIAEPEYSKVLY
jgi:hypothetical protein